jgi:hypothetical protein
MFIFAIYQNNGMAAQDLSELEKRLSLMTLEDLRGADPLLADKAYEIALSLPEEHAVVFEKEGSLYSLVRLAGKLEQGGGRKGRALAKRLGKLAVLCADLVNKPKGETGAHQKKSPPHQKKFVPPKSALHGPEEIAAPKWMKIVSSIEKNNRLLKEKVGREADKAKQDAMRLACELNEHAIGLFREWAAKLGNEKEDMALALAYAKRLLDEQNYRSSKANIRRIMERKGEGAVRMEGDFNLLPPGLDKRKLDALVENGYEIKTVLDHNCREFIGAYAVLREHFPPDELDPAKDLMAMLDSGASFNRSYVKYYLATASDPGGKVVGAMDGNYFGSKTVSALYGAHVGVIAEEQKLGVATLLSEAALTAGNLCAAEAERAWKRREVEVDYAKLLEQSLVEGDVLIKGNRLMFVIGEVEPVNLASMEDAQSTIERNLIHGRMLGFSVIPLLDYKQVDLNKPADYVYIEVDGKPPSDWNTVPLLLYVRRMGKENAKTVSAGEARLISGVMRDIFLESGLYSADGVEADYRHSVARIAHLKDGDMILIYALPREGTKAELLEKIFALIPSIGTMDQRCTQFYPDYLWSKKYLEKYGKALESGTAVTLGQAREYLLAEAAKDPVITAARD